jgi:Chitobiase/beta-hexosaminidase C-terminal domain/Bacterial Ig-like domain
MSIDFKDANGNNQAFTTSINGKVLTVTPTTILKEGVKYTLTIHPGAVKDLSGNPGALSVSSFTTAGSAPTVTSNPGTGSYWAPVSVVLAASETATIYYTTDSTNPTVTSAKYTSPIYLATSRVVKFMGIDTAGNPGLVATQFYTIYALQYYKYYAKVRIWGRYKYSYKVRYKRWYRSHGRWRYYYRYVTKTKWKTGWHYVGVWKTASKWVLT